MTGLKFHFPAHGGDSLMRSGLGIPAISVLSVFQGPTHPAHLPATACIVFCPQNNADQLCDLKHVTLVFLSIKWTRAIYLIEYLNIKCWNPNTELRSCLPPCKPWTSQEVFPGCSTFLDYSSRNRHMALLHIFTIVSSLHGVLSQVLTFERKSHAHAYFSSTCST